MTARLSQDPVENLFGIVRQSSGCNVHTTSQQFLVTISCLSFYGLAKSLVKSNSEPTLLTALLDRDDACGGKPDKHSLIETLIEEGNLSGAEHHVQQLRDAAPEHAECVSQKSDERLIFYICGYVAIKFVLKAKCEQCRETLLTKKECIGQLRVADYTRLRDKGGSLYPSGHLFRFIRDLENLFTSGLSTRELHHESVMDVTELVRKKQEIAVGCPVHAHSVVAEITAFYVTTLLHFLVKSLNRTNANRRETSNYLRLSRCT